MELPLSHFKLKDIKESQVKIETSLEKAFVAIAKDKSETNKFVFLESLIAAISNYSHDEIKHVTGKLSDFICDLSNKIDWDHKYAPNNINALDPVGFEKFVAIIREQLNLYRNSKDQYPNILELIPHAISNLKDFKNVKNNLLKLSSHVRLFNDAAVREKMRAKKKQKNILYLDSYSGDNIVKFWLSLPDNINYLCRGFSKLGYFSHDLVTKSINYERQGYLDLANNLKHGFQNSTYINGVDEEVVDQENNYHGFCRIKMCRMALAIAKANGFIMSSGTNTVENITGFSVSAGRNSEYFKEFGFKAINEAKVIESIDGVEKTDSTVAMINTSSKLDIYKFEPRAYPLNTLKGLKKSPHVEKMLQWCENCPQINNKTLFDHYWIVVPGIAVNSYNQFYDSMGRYCIINPATNKANIFSDSHQAAAYLDKLMIENNLLFPALLGEKDGKCYFISIWN